MALGGSFNAGSIIVFLTEVSLGSVALGLVFGLLLLLWLRFIFNDTIIEMTLTLVVSYIAFFTAQDALGISGILTVMILGMFYAAFGKTASKGDNQQSLHHFWELVAYVANTLIFILSGVVITDGVLQYGTHFENHGTSWGFLLLLYVFVQISRVLVVCLFYPLLRYFGYGLDLKEATILVWSGLRGAVSLSLSLSVKHAGDTAQSFLKPEVGIMESALVIARLFIPGIFEKLAMHEMRLLIAETSSVNGVYNVGEDIILDHNYVGILLEGNLRTEDQNMIASPGVLLPSNNHSNFAKNSSAMVNYCASPSYQVEARARIIFLKTGGQQANLQRGSSSISQTRSNTGSCPAPLDTSLEEIIVTVDSPNKLSLSQSSGAPRGS